MSIKITNLNNFTSPTPNTVFLGVDVDSSPNVSVKVPFSAFALVGGANTQIQFNDDGEFAGDSGLTFDKTTKSISVGGATVSTNAPVLNLSQTWNNAGVTFTGLKFNVTDTASAAGSLLMDLQVGGVSKFKVAKTGTILVAEANAQPLISTGTGAANAAIRWRTGNTIAFSSGDNSVYIPIEAKQYYIDGSARLFAINGYIRATNYTDTGYYPFQGLSYKFSTDTEIVLDAANTLAQRNSTNAQTFRLYNTYTDASNYERGILDWSASANVFTIGTQAAGSGTARGFQIVTGGTKRFDYGITDQFTATISAGFSVNAGAGYGCYVGNDGFQFALKIGLASDVPSRTGISADIWLFRDAANTLAQRNSTNAQTFRLYNTYTDASNYERGFLKWDTNVLKIGTEKAGTGSARALEFQTDGTTRLTISTTGRVTFDASGWFAEGSGMYSGAGNPLFLKSTGGAFVGITSQGSGILKLDDASTSFDRLQFGGTTSSFPAIKRSTTALQVRLADDSDFTTIQAKLQTHANAVSETVTTTHTLILYDAAGNAYKVPCVAS